MRTEEICFACLIRSNPNVLTSVPDFADLDVCAVVEIEDKNTLIFLMGIETTTKAFELLNAK